MNLTTAYAELKKQSESTPPFLESKGIAKKEMTFSLPRLLKTMQLLMEWEFTSTSLTVTDLLNK